MRLQIARAGAGLLVGGVFWTGAALGEPARRVNLVWSNEDASCIDASTLAATVEHTLGRAVFHADAPPGGTVVGSARAVDTGGYSAHVSLLATDGTKVSERFLATDGDCQRLDESIAVVVSLMVDGVDEPTVPLRVAPEPPRPPKAPPVPVETPPPPVPREPARASTAALALGVGAGVARGLLPTTTPAVALRAEVEVPGFIPIMLAARAYGSSDARIDGAGGEFDAWTGELSLCPTVKPGHGWRLGVCLGAGAGAIHGSPVGLVGGRISDAPIVFALAAPTAALHVAGPFWLRAEAGLPVLLVPARWGFLDGSGNYVEVYRSEIVAPFGFLSAELRSDP
jgi:hypothetical protein